MSTNHIFPDLAGFDHQTSFMQKRTLLEFIMIKNILGGIRTIPLENILNEAEINHKNCERLDHILQSVSYNNIVFLAHQSLHNISIFSDIHLDLTLDCNPFFINKWATNAGQNQIYAFSNLPNDILDHMKAELTEKINKMKKIINAQN